MEQTTSLKTKIFTSSFLWNIQNFLDYKSCYIDHLKSEEIKFKEIDASWFLEINQPRDSSAVKISIVLNENAHEDRRLFRAEIKVESGGHELMSPANRHLVERRGFYAEPAKVKFPSWVLDYQPNNETAYENNFFIEDDSLNGSSIATFLDAGVLTIDARVTENLNFCFLTNHLFLGFYQEN
jgi:hypothetical protein